MARLFAGKADLADAPGDQLQAQFARAQVLGRRHDAGSDVAAPDQGILDLPEQHVDAGAAQATAQRGLGGAQGPLEVPGLLAFEPDPVDHETGRLLRRIPCKERCLRTLQPYVGL